MILVFLIIAALKRALRWISTGLQDQLEDPFGQFFGVERLGDKSADMELYGLLHIFTGGVGREDEDGGEGGVGVGSEGLAEVEPAGAREEEVDDDQVPGGALECAVRPDSGPEK